MAIVFPNDSAAYRAARNKLLEHEIALRRQLESVAAELRALPDGGQVREDYTFDRVAPDGTLEAVRMSALFGDRNTLMLYHYMFPRHSTDVRPGPSAAAFAGSLRDGPCPSCTALIDMWDGTMPHFRGLGGNLVARTTSRAASSCCGTA